MTDSKPDEKKAEVAKKEAPQSLELIIQKEGVMEVAMARIEALMSSNSLHVPPDYSPQNAVRSAWLIIQETKDMAKKPVLESCSKVSIMYALLDMVTQGLNAAKKQCYFIAYTDKLVCQCSYFGRMYLAKRADPKIDKINARAVFEGDDFKYELVDGDHIITKHVQTLESMASKVVIAAYCVIMDKDGKMRYGEVMPLDRIKRSWGMSKAKVVDENGKIKAGTPHDKFTDEMAIRTVINHICKRIINSSNDAHLVDAMAANEQTVARVTAEEAALLSENKDVIDIEPDKKPVEESVPAGAPDSGKGPDF